MGAAGVGAVGLCAPGVQDAGGTMVVESVNVPGIVGVTFAELVRDAIGSATGVRAVSDAHAGAYDLWCERELSGRLLAIAIGTGVGACVLDGGEPLRVVGHSSGHLGQIDVSLDETGDAVPIGRDGGRGSLEAYIGLPAIEKATSRTADDAVYTLTVDSAGVRALVRAIRIAHAIYRPNHIGLLGGVGVRLEGLIPGMVDAVSRDLTRLARPGWTLFTGSSDFHSASGAARLAERP